MQCHVIITSADHADGHTAVGVRALRDQRPLWACLARGDAGVALALIEAVHWCAVRGLAIVTPDAGVIARAA